MADDESQKNSDLLKLLKDRRTDRRKATTRRRIRTGQTPERMDGILGKYFKKDPFVLRQIEQSKAILAWERIVGKSTAQVSRALRIRGHRLIVQVKNPLWKQQLLMLKTQILERYRQEYPKLKLTEIFFVNE